MAQDLIKYSNVNLRLKELDVLNGVNFTIQPGQFCFLIGKVGSGKSTLLRSIYADVPIAEGYADVLGYDLTTIRRKEIPFLRRRIGFVFQDFQLLTDRNVYFNLEFVLNATGWTNKADKEQRIEEVLKMVGMEKKHYKMPFELSGGEQQRIAIARALLNNPEIILADEPTGNLDPETGEHIMKMLYEIAQGGTAVIIATHNHAFLQKYQATVYNCENKNLVKKMTSQV
mgnify:FL=1